MHKLWAGCSLFLLWVAPCGAANGPFTIEQVMSAPFASELTASPVGARIAWVENEQGRRNVWWANGPAWKAVQATHFDQDDGQDIADLAWSPDGSYLLFSRGGDFENGGENPNPSVAAKRPDQSIWRLGFDSTPPAKLTEGRAAQISSQNKIIFLRKGMIYGWDGAQASELVRDKGEASSLRWAPDGSAFAFVSERGGHSFIGLYDDHEQRLRYLDPSVDEDSNPVWSHDGKQIAFIRIPTATQPAFFSASREGQPWSIRVANVRSGDGRELFCARPGRGSIFREVASEDQLWWTAEGRLVFPWERTGWLHLYSVAAAGGEPADLTPGDGEVEHIALTANGKEIYFSSNRRQLDGREVWRVSPDGSGKPPTRETTDNTRIEWQPAPLADGSGVAFLNSSFDASSHTTIRTRLGEMIDSGPAVPSEFPTKELVRPQSVMLTAADGLELHGQLFLPSKGTGPVRHPALIFFHGGSRRQMLPGFHYMYYYSNAYAMNQFLASQGYVVLAVNYRSGIGYGLDFREAIDYGARGGSEFNDVMGAGLYLKARADVDGKRIGVWGGSYGGYLTALALARASDLFAAGVDFHGVHDWSSLRGYLSRGLVSGDPNEMRQRQEAARIAFESSPMASVDTWRSPVLLIHGDDDRNVEFSQTMMLVEALRKRNVALEELIFPDEIHDFLLARHWVEAYRATADFFGRKLGRPVGEQTPLVSEKR